MKLRHLLVLAVLLLLITAPTLAQDTNDIPAPPGFESWEQVVEQARGTTINWYKWGGSDSINNFVDEFYGTVLKEEFDITLNQVNVAEITQALDLIQSEVQAGRTDGNGSVDIIWINGENFYTLRQADLLYGPWAQTIPNSVLVDWENPAINLDFGFPTDGYESPWSSAQFNFIYDSARFTEDTLPRSYAELTEWIAANPGRFTYLAPGPGAFTGTRFVKQIFFELSGGHEQWLGEFNEDLYNEWAPQVWELLNSWEPNLWRNGETYATTQNELNQLFANGEVDFTFTQSPSGAATGIASGDLPETAQAFAFDANLIGDFNYVAIPDNASNIAGALVLANLILRPDLQAAQVIPENGFGGGFGIDVTRVTDPEQAAVVEEALANLGAAAAPQADLAAALVSDIAAEYQNRIEADWEANVLRN